MSAPPTVCPQCRTWFEGRRCPTCGFSSSHKPGPRAIFFVLTVLCLSGLLFALDGGERSPLLSYTANALLVFGLLAAFFIVAQLAMRHPPDAPEESAPASTPDSSTLMMDVIALRAGYGYESPGEFDSDGGGGSGD